MTDLFMIEDGDNIERILVHHLGHPGFDEDAEARVRFDALERDLLRYCTRLRCQPETKAHTDSQGYQVPEHKIILNESC